MDNPCLCKNHLRQVANYFSREVAFAYQIDERECVICNKVIFIEGARRYIQQMPLNTNEASSFVRFDQYASFGGS